MSFLRRLYLVLLTLLLIAGITLFLLFPRTVNGWSATLSDQSPLIPVIVAAILDVLLLALLYIQVRPDPRNRATGLMMQASGAITEVSVESARARILKAVSDVPDVVSADAEVKPVHGKADIELQVTVLGHDVELPAKQKEINRALNQVIHKQLGLRMAGQPRVHIRFHGDEDEEVKTFAPIVAPAHVKPVETNPPPKPIIVEPEPPKPVPVDVVNLPKTEEPVEKVKAVELPVIRNEEEKVAPVSGLSEHLVKENDDLADLDLDKEIANPAADDIVEDELFKNEKPIIPASDEHSEEKPLVVGQDEDHEDKSDDTSDSEKEPDLNNRPI